ncbi:MAG: sigma-70 family RNA polymerase sigma factor, partial [Clostridia bacterium]|nr:sigma-70 family RNA polymerase sigma factor [Clostridia bacterium]
MEHSIVIKKLNECLKDIFAFSLSRLYDKQDAEDLTNEIIAEVLTSADRLQNNEAFYGYMWKIAENTFKKFIRSKKTTEVEYAENFVGVCWDTPLDKITEDEEVTLLRRELSLLSKQYRDVTIQFYIENKSCPVISKELGISEEMVKYYLFKTRK